MIKSLARTSAAWFTLSTLVAGCAGVNPSELQAVVKPSQIEVTSPLTYSEMAGAFSGRAKMEYTLSSGVYTSRFQDPSGTYFEGAGKCLRLQGFTADDAGNYTKLAVTNIFRCGFFVPHAVSGVPRIYFYRNPPEDPSGLGTPFKPPATDHPFVASSALGGAAQGAALGLVGALDEAERKNMQFPGIQPAPGAMARAIRVLE